MQYKINQLIILLTESRNLFLGMADQHNLSRKQPALYDSGRLFLLLRE